MALGLSLSLIACGDDDGGTQDSGMMEAGPMGDGGMEDADIMMEAGPMIGAPYIVRHLPEDAEDEVDPSTSILLLFSESMSQVGTVTVEPGGFSLDASMGQWASDTDLGIDNDPPRENIAVILDLPMPLTGGVEYTVRAMTDFADAGGAALDSEVEFTFRTADREAPQVVSSTPMEGAMGVSAGGITTVSVTFNEEMNTAIGSARITGGPGRLGDPSWDVQTITWPVTGVDYGGTYQIILEDFFDRAGNALDGMPYLGNGAIDFTTGEDVDSPFVASSVPTENQRGVNPAATDIRVVFSEEMDPTATDAVFSDGMTPETLTGTWSEGNTVLTFDITGRLSFMNAYTLDFTGSGLTDVAGNIFDTTTYLTDGILNFTVETDTFGPRVVESTPLEGARDVDYSLATISLRFDEPMDESVTVVSLSDGAGSVNLRGAWSASGTLFDIDVREQLRAGRDYTIDLTAFSDTSGNSLDATDAYLGDGILNFTSIPPTGDTCSEALTFAEATTIPMGYEWMIPSQSLTDDGSTDSCDGDSSGGAGDLVIEYVKTSGNLASGGALLNIQIESGSSSDLNFEVRRDACDPSESEDNILSCQESIETGGTTLDLEAGTYYIWIAKESSGTFPGATVQVTEISAWPEGESCNNPFTTASSSVYLAPSAPDRPHIFQIRPEAITTFDRDRVSNGPGEISCSTVHGSDAVIRFDKMAGSVLEIDVVPADIRSGAADLNFEVSLGCDPAGSSYTSLACENNFDRVRSATVSGPAGAVYVWVSSDDRDAPFPGATVQIREVTVAEGESCGTARPLTMTTSPVTLDSTRSLGGSSCITGSSNITWYSYTATEDLVLVSGNAMGDDEEIILLDQESNLEFACAEDATKNTPAMVRSGRTVCIGVPNTSTITELTVTEQPYSGITGTVTDLAIGRALNRMGTEESWLSDRWMTTTTDSVFLGEFSDVYFAPKAGGTRSVLVELSSSVIGDTALGIGNDLFSLDDSSSSSTKLYRLSDGSTFPWMAEDWEGSFTWPTSWSDREDVISMTYDGTSIILANHETTSSSPTIFYIANPSTAGLMELARSMTVENVTGIAADATYIYLLGERRDGTDRIQGVHRLPRAGLTDPMTPAETIAEFSMGSVFSGRGLFIDNTTTATMLYTRNVGFSVGNQLLAIVNPAGAAPLFLGPILRLGTTGDAAMTYDAADNAIYLFESETDSNGRIVRVN